MMLSAKKLMLAIIAGLSILGCSQKAVVQETQEQPQLEVGEAIYQKTVPGTEDGEVTLELSIPLVVRPASVLIDSVYFNGLKAPLRKTTSNGQLIYKANIRMRTGEKVKVPMSLQPNEAVIVYRYESKRFLMKVANLKESEAIYAP